MTLLVAESLIYLLWMDCIIHRRNGQTFWRSLKTVPAKGTCRSTVSIERICRAADIACVLYFKEVLCLQRSVSTTMLLRRNGIHAELVIGARTVPFSSHAWVEVDKVVVNDRSYMPQVFRELERC
jgi:hypothetical protein